MESFDTKLMCRVLGVPRSGYYDWCRRQDQAPSARAAQDKLLAEIRQINLRFGYYGYPLIHPHHSSAPGSHSRGRSSVPILTPEGPDGQIRLAAAHAICGMCGR